MSPWKWIVSIAMGLVALLVLVLGAHTPDTPGAPGAGSDVTRILYWEKWTGAEGEQLKAMVDLFNRTEGKEKKIWVDVVTMTAIDQKTLVATAAGVPPDVAGLWETQLVQFAAMDAVEPLDDMMAAAAIPGIDKAMYKPVYRNIVEWKGKWWGFISTPSAAALHWNKEAFVEAGLDPENGYPRTLAELDAMAEKLTVYETGAGGKKRLKRSGFLPTEPGWWINSQAKWWGAKIFDESAGPGGSLALNAPEMIASFDWIASYSRKYGSDAISEFKSGLGQHASAQNSFISGTVSMELQGPWEANFIDAYRPEMNRWKLPPEQVAREKNVERVKNGMSIQEAESILGPATLQAQAGGRTEGGAIYWDAGIKEIDAKNEHGVIENLRVRYKPAKLRRPHTGWGAAPFPVVLPGRTDAGPASADILVVPKGSKHKREAFTFIAFLNKRENMEKLCSDHCKNSPLASVSENFVDRHPNPYMETFERIGRSPNAFVGPQFPLWSETGQELVIVSQKVALLESSAEEALTAAQKRLEGKWDDHQRVDRLRRGVAAAGSGTSGKGGAQ